MKPEQMHSQAYLNARKVARDLIAREVDRRARALLGVTKATIESLTSEFLETEEGKELLRAKGFEA